MNTTMPGVAKSTADLQVPGRYQDATTARTKPVRGGPPLKAARVNPLTRTNTHLVRLRIRRVNELPFRRLHRN
jgi:hypothetical protein